jgi:hypothetical protein
MGKKQKEETPNINSTPNCNIIQRLISYIKQARISNPSPHLTRESKYPTIMLKKPAVERRRNTGENRLQAILHGVMFSACA